MTDKEKNTLVKVIVSVVIILILFFVGYVVGKKSVEIIQETRIDYIQLPTIHDTIVKPKPYIVTIPVDTTKILEAIRNSDLFEELFPGKVDTIYTQADSSHVLRDWATTREYSEVLFDSDTLGKLKVSTKVQYNRQQNIGYDFTPIQKQTTTTKKEIGKFEPFIGVGFIAGFKNSESELKNIGPEVELGGYIKEHHGIALQYQYLINTNKSTNFNTHEVGLKYLYKF